MHLCEKFELETSRVQLESQSRIFKTQSHTFTDQPLLDMWVTMIRFKTGVEENLCLTYQMRQVYQT